MGIFSKLFGGGGARKAPRPPPWAREAFGDDGDRYLAFVDVVGTVLADAGIDVTDDDIRSGSLTLRIGHEFREWVLDTIARTCAAAPADQWPALVETDRAEVGFSAGRSPAGRGDADGTDADADAQADDRARDDDADDRRANEMLVLPRTLGDLEPVSRFTFGSWGGVQLGAGGYKTIVLVMLPVEDRLTLARAQLPDGFSITVVVCNHRDVGHLAATEVAKLAEVDHLYAVDADAPVDRGRPAGDTGYRGDAPSTLSIRQLDALDVAELHLQSHREHGCVVARWHDGETAIVGDAIPLSFIGAVKPALVIGRIVADKPADARGALAALAGAKRIVLIANVPGLAAREVADMLAMLGVSALVLFGPTVDPSVAASRRMKIVAHMIAGELDRADQCARDGITAGDDAAELTYQRAMIALMRADETAAIALLDGLDTPHAQSSRASIARMRGDANATELTLAVLARMPGDPIAIRGAVLAQIKAGDPTAATKLLADNREHLDVEHAVGLEQLIARPDEVELDLAHSFPAHASLAMEAIEPLVTAGRYAEAEPMLRRIRGWDAGNYAITAELGVVLANQNKLADAIAVYDESIARGGGANLLRFNRGNCMAKTERFDEAIADYRFCVDIKPDWHEARLSLASALNARGDRAAARTERDQLKERGAPEHYLAALDEVLDS